MTGLIHRANSDWVTEWSIEIRFPTGIENGILLSATESRPAVEPTQPLFNGYLSFLSAGIKRTGFEDDHSPPVSAKFKNAWNYAFTPPCVFMTWCLTKQRRGLHSVVFG